MSEASDDWKDIRPFLPPAGERLTLPTPERPLCEDCHERPRERGLTVCRPCWEAGAELQRKAEHYGDPYAG